MKAEDRAKRNNNWLTIFGRLKPGVTLAQAQSDMTGLAKAFASEKLQADTESLRLELLHRSMSDGVIRSVLWFTFGLAGFVLLIACANVANLQLVRTATRAREYALRAALGAQRGRLLRQSLIESLTVSLVGGLISLLLAYVAVDFINRRLFAELPGAKVSPDLSVFAFALVSSVLTGLAFGMVPAWIAARSDINQVLKSDQRGCDLRPFAQSTAARAYHWRSRIRPRPPCGRRIADSRLGAFCASRSGLECRRIADCASESSGNQLPYKREAARIQ